MFIFLNFFYVAENLLFLTVRDLEEGQKEKDRCVDRERVKQ